jgi:hypothetical protein
MKGRRGGSKTMVMLALLAVLLVSLGYLSMQGGGREGMCSLSEQKDEIGCLKLNGKWTPPPVDGSGNKLY